MVAQLERELDNWSAVGLAREEPVHSEIGRDECGRHSGRLLRVAVFVDGR